MGPCSTCFGADTSGRDFAHGKPDPEIFLAAAQELGAAPAECLVVEDAAAGVQAAKAGGMAAIGVARGGEPQLLREAGADLVVETLDRGRRRRRALPGSCARARWPRLDQ